MSNETITLKLDSSKIDQLYKTWSEYASEKIPPYCLYQLRPENCVITAYTSGKVVFQGKDASVYASSIQGDVIHATESITRNNMQSEKNIYPQAGSDEVGTGDYFGPVCVCATIVTSDTALRLKELHVGDSKGITDKEIRNIAPKLQEILPHSLLILEPIKYNEVHAKYNMNAIKAKLHNQAYYNLSRRESLPDFCIIDQFAPETTYYRYLRDDPHIMRGIHFETKAENKYLSVGAASIIARNAFLEYMDAMGRKYSFLPQKGGGKAADECAVEFVNQHGIEELPHVAKMHFANTERVLKQMNDNK